MSYARNAARTLRGCECDYCHKSIDSSAVEYEVEAVVMPGPRSLHFHRICEHLWETAVTRVEALCRCH